MLPREKYEALEEQWLSPYAAHSVRSLGRDREDKPCDFRTVYQRDRDRILHSASFRRLKHKTQVFLAPEGDHYRTRLTHTLEVSQIARTIARALQLNEDLTEAISLGHDLGHTPFGHAGEKALDELMPGGFRHYEQSVRVVEKLENNGQGLNLTREVRDGMLCHTTGRPAVTLEGRLVRLADRIAYINHDMDDATRAGLLQEQDIPEDIRAVLGHGRTARIDTLIASAVHHSVDDICLDEEVSRAFDRLHAFMFENLYRNPAAKSEESKVYELIRHMFCLFVEQPDRLPADYQRIREQEGTERAVCDFIASMSDQYAINTYQTLFIPRGWQLNIDKFR